MTELRTVPPMPVKAISPDAPDNPLTTPAPHAPAYVSKEGILIPFPRLHPQLIRHWRAAHNRQVSELDGVLIPPCRFSDEMRAQPPLAIALSLPELHAILLAEDCGLSAATFFGPPQEKTDNEDFALAATLLLPDGTPCSFAAVADGVTTRTFWPQRSSRLACLGALRVFARHVQRGAGTSEADIKDVRADLTTTLHDLLEQDRRILLRRKVTPPGWNPDTFRRHTKKLDHWYNSTLLVAFSDPSGAFLLWTGDGGIAIEKRFRSGEAAHSRPLHSTDDLAVSNVVSLSRRIRFSAGRVARTPDLDGITVILCSDGVDRTRQSNPVRSDDAPAGSGLLLAQLQAMAASKKAEIDNYSAAILRTSFNMAIPLRTRQSSAALANILVAPTSTKRTTD